MATPQTLFRFDPSVILQPAQGYFAAMDAGACGPNLTIWSGQALATINNGGGTLYPYSSQNLPSGNISAPTVANAAGGSLALGTYYGVVTALFGLGETRRSNESAGVNTSNGYQTLNWSWTAVPGATAYNFYRTAANGGAGTEAQQITVPATVLSLVDNGSISFNAVTAPVNNSTGSAAYGTACAISQYPFVTDSNGMAYFNYSTYPWVPASTTSNFWLTPKSTVPFFYRGAFNPNDLVSFDSYAIAQMGGRYLPDGNILFP
jgi:hypothetical protein